MILKDTEVFPTLSSYINIANIPKRCGGEYNFEHGTQLDLDPAIKKIIDRLAPCNGSLPKDR